MSNNRSAILFFNYTQEPEYYMQVSDILCLPSYREGFGNVIIEAAMCGIPSITSSIYGLRDVVESNRTGLTFNVGDIDELSYLIKDLINWRPEFSIQEGMTRMMDYYKNYVDNYIP